MVVGAGMGEAADMPFPPDPPRRLNYARENRVLPSAIARQDSEAMTIAGLRWRFLVAVTLAGAAMLGVLAALGALT
jgi:hypothetical protein